MHEFLYHLCPVRGNFAIQIHFQPKISTEYENDKSTFSGYGCRLDIVSFHGFSRRWR